MIRFYLQKMISEKQFRENRRITMAEITEATGINRVTLSKMINQKGYSTVTDNLDKLCKFFDCKLDEIAEYCPDEET
ncbi:MAG: helix-turn-helix transcriptional regulator [Methylotenera sp.]|jgi:DNA-binding Xre family transcriptional regulator|nr:helix-turn-helix transcriptional regulator [Methylotenera sp.]